MIKAFPPVNKASESIEKKIESSNVNRIVEPFQGSVNISEQSLYFVKCVVHYFLSLL